MTPIIFPYSRSLHGDGEELFRRANSNIAKKRPGGGRSTEGQSFSNGYEMDMLIVFVVLAVIIKAVMVSKKSIVGRGLLVIAMFCLATMGLFFESKLRRYASLGSFEYLYALETERPGKYSVLIHPIPQIRGICLRLTSSEGARDTISSDVLDAMNFELIQGTKVLHYQRARDLPGKGAIIFNIDDLRGRPVELRYDITESLQPLLRGTYLSSRHHEGYLNDSAVGGGLSSLGMYVCVFSPVVVCAILVIREAYLVSRRAEQQALVR